MGGNIILNGIQPRKFLVKPYNRSCMAESIRQTIVALIKSLERDSGIWVDWKPCGSTANFLNATIPDSQWDHLLMSDLDIMIDYKHRELVETHIQANPAELYGSYVILPEYKRHGTSTSYIITDGIPRQLDFVFVHQPVLGSAAAFLNSSCWKDVNFGFKGAHHKILLNACGLDEWKFSIIYGLMSRIDPLEYYSSSSDIAYKLFGPKAQSDWIKSFHSLVANICLHYDKRRVDLIYEKFKDSISKLPYDSSKAVRYFEESKRV